MNNAPEGWRYTARVCPARREALARPGSFERLVQLVCEDARILGVRAKPGIDVGLTDCWQPIYELELPKTGDALYNGPFGYRAQYWQSAERALGANAVLLAALAPQLLALKRDHVAELDKIDVGASLAAASAKIWIKEKVYEVYVFESGHRDLAVERWTARADSGAYPGADKAGWGLTAPEVSIFEVKGALISPDGHEVVPQRKITRHREIFEFGFS